jgi:hypothetical protein
MKADRKLWLTDGRDELVEDGDPRAAFLYCTEGKMIEEAEARSLGYQSSEELGLADDPSAAFSGDEGEKSDDAGADKAQAAGANKARQPRARPKAAARK